MLERYICHETEFTSDFFLSVNYDGEQGRVIGISKIQLEVDYKCCALIGWATTRLYVIAHW